jgi:hypothetical protein
MKLTESMLKKIIKEEIQAVLKEGFDITAAGEKTHANNLMMAKTMDAKELAAKIKLPEGLPDLNSYRKFIEPIEDRQSSNLARAINLLMRSPAAKKIHGTRF